MRIILFICLLLVGLNMGLLFAHTLESPVKMQYEGSLYLTLQNTLYRWFGPPIGAALEIGSLLSSLVLVFLMRNRGSLLYYMLSTTFLLVIAIIVYFIFSDPVNKIFKDANVQSLPENWKELRIQWENSQIIRFGLYLCSFIILLAGILKKRNKSRFTS
jgi:Domain of unknown function (DUF1772)